MQFANRLRTTTLTTDVEGTVAQVRPLHRFLVFLSELRRAGIVRLRSVRTWASILPGPHAASCLSQAALEAIGHSQVRLTVQGMRRARPLSLSSQSKSLRLVEEGSQSLRAHQKASPRRWTLVHTSKDSFWILCSAAKPGYKTPLVADIHFTPKVALVCADFVDKVRLCIRSKHRSVVIANDEVRVNPGNFADGCSRSIESRE